MRKIVKIFRTLSTLFIVFGFIFFALGGFLSIENKSTGISPLITIGFIMFGLGVIGSAISNVLRVRLGGGLIGTVTNVLGEIKSSIAKQEEEDMLREMEINSEIEAKKEEKQQVTCAYCNTTYNKSLPKCPGCGAQKK